MHKFAQDIRAYFESNYTVAGLKMLLIVWAVLIIVLALLVDNPWILAGILAYEVLP
jgi:uncharacterized membrane protein